MKLETGNMEPEMTPRERNRRGVALIVVLGFLSIMLMMAVAFVMHARMERLVSSSTLEAMRGRQILRTGINAAMNDYSRYLWGANLVMPVRLEDQVFVSESSGTESMGGRTIGQDGIELMVGEVSDWIPSAYRTAAVSNEVARAQWVVVRETPGSGSSRILGRYAYAIFDMSGGIDANLIARETEIAGHDARAASNRVRRSVRHVPMRLLPETADAGEFKRLRRGWKGFDSLQTLIHLSDGKPNDGNDSPSFARWQPERREQYGAGLVSNLVSDLTPFSLSAYRGGRYDRGTGRWTAPKLLNNISDVTEWIEILNPVMYQFPSAMFPLWFPDAINDYTNNRVTPLRADYPSPKNVPMFNEITGYYELIEEEIPSDPGFSRYTLRLDIAFEFWYPFPSKDNYFPPEASPAFVLPAPIVGGSLATAGLNGEDIWFRIMMPGAADGIVELVTAEAAVSREDLTTYAMYNNGLPYLPRDATLPHKPFLATNITYRIPIRHPAPAHTNLLPSGLILRVQGWKVNRPIYLIGPDGNADMVPKELSFPGANLDANSNPRRLFARAATDPRLNHLTGQWTDNEGGGAGSLDRMNDWFYDSQARIKYLEEGFGMYCRNKPMESPAELGYISTGIGPWETIDLLTDGGIEMLANLVADTNLWITATGGIINPWADTSVFYTNGTINPNTQSSNVLMSAFIDLATHEVPNVHTNIAPRIPPFAPTDDPYVNYGMRPLNDDNTIDGQSIAERIVAEILDETQAGTFVTTFQAGTDWARIPCLRQGGALSRMEIQSTSPGSAPSAINNNMREHLLRNTWGLFSPENSLFTVVVVAQAIKEGPGNVGIWNAADDMVTGERRAVALVWRDPFKTGQNLHHEMFIRMFRYLND